MILPRNTACRIMGLLALVFGPGLVMPTAAQVPTAASTVAAPAATPTNETIVVYEIKHAGAIDLRNILNQLLPTVKVVLGPQPAFLQKQVTGERLGEAATGPVAAAADSKYIADEFVRNLILSGPVADVERARKLLGEIDTAAPQVLIEAKVVEMSLDLSTRLGVNWDFAPTGTTAQFTLGTPQRKGPPESVIFGRLNRAPIQFDATLDAAIQHDRAKLLANPRLMVLYNHRAQIFIGDEVTYLIGSQATINGSNLQTANVRIGVELNVVATAHPDSTITLRVHPEVGNLLNLTTLANGVTLPQISRRFADTEVRIKDGETLVIGGLIGQNETRTEIKIPILGDLPLLGYLFKHESKTHNDDDLVIFIKASVVKD
jgi:type II secretory pathway component GspD/PulD (secretin)